MSVCVAESGIDPEAEEEPETEEEQLFLRMAGVEVPLGRANTSVVFSRLLPFEREGTGCVFLAVLMRSRERRKTKRKIRRLSVAEVPA